MNKEQLAEQYAQKNYIIPHDKIPAFYGFLAGYDAALTAQPMDSAPKDGSEIFVKMQSGRWIVCYWHITKYCFVDSMHNSIFRPQCWRPL